MTQTIADAADRDTIATALDDTLVVEAAAGTGKTTELVRRIVRIIESGRVDDANGRADVSRIVAVTFTEKAAGELKLRLRESLEAARRKATTGSPSLRRLDDALARLEEAQISTIHGFCADLLRERPVEACVDPLFSVLTEGQAHRLFEGAFARWMEEQLSSPPEGVRRSLRRPTFSGFGMQPEFDDGPIDRLKRAGWELIQWRDFTGKWVRQPFNRRARIEELIETLDRFSVLLDTPANPYDNLFVDSRPARQLHAELRRSELVAARDDDRLEAAFVELGRNRDFKNARKGQGRTYRQGVLREDVWQARESLMALLAAFERDANADLAALLKVELETCVAYYEEAKSRAGALDFLDLLLKARNLIRDDRGVRESFQRRFGQIFVDEFQDTDPLQAEILMLLAADDPSVSNWHDVTPIAGKLFIVGDPKQSIYRFRRADVGVYRTVYERLRAAGARQVKLQTSFRSRPNIQRTINAAFSRVMTGDAASLQADYVPLQPFRPDTDDQPSVVVLPVPRPYGSRRVSNIEVEKSLPDAVGAYVQWLINDSGWKVAERADAAPGHQTLTSKAVGFRPGEGERLVPVQARHICLLFRRFVSFDEDATRPYVQALEARSIPHLLVGGRSFHNRAEIETLRAALAAIEWPDDELSVFATLRGSLFAIGDEELVEFRHHHGRLHPFRWPADGEVADEPAPNVSIVNALRLLQRLHKRRNRVPVSATVSSLLEATRAHVGFALEHGGEQVLANVSHVAELARRYEAEGGISFRGFLDELRTQAESGEATEAPILEEGSDGVRLMTVHKAKGLEFPVVILVDMTAKLNRATASRYLDASRNICAVQLAGCSPRDLLDHEQDELRRDTAEGERLAYVAATRARDLLVIPAVGDEARDGWVAPLNAAIYPPFETRRQQSQAAGCVPFTSKDTVLARPDGDPATATTVCPGLHIFENSHQVVWWDPGSPSLKLDMPPPMGLRRAELIVKDVPQKIVERGMSEYERWRAARSAAIDSGARPSISPQTATAWARLASSAPVDVEVIELPRADGRPSGPRFGALVHAVLASVPLDGDAGTIGNLARSHSRVLSATDDEAAWAADVVRRVLGHALLGRARKAAIAHRCRREVPVTWRSPDGTLVEGTVDLAFEEKGRWTIVDFKTDEEFQRIEGYLAQVSLYRDAVSAAMKAPAEAVLLRI